MNDIELVICALKEVVSEPHWYDIDCIDEGYRAALRLEELKPVAWLWKDGTVTTDPDRADGTWAKLYALDEVKK